MTSQLNQLTPLKDRKVSSSFSLWFAPMSEASWGTLQSQIALMSHSPAPDEALSSLAISRHCQRGAHCSTDCTSVAAASMP